MSHATLSNDRRAATGASCARGQSETQARRLKRVVADASQDATDDKRRTHIAQMISNGVEDDVDGDEMVMRRRHSSTVVSQYAVYLTNVGRYETRRYAAGR